MKKLRLLAWLITLTMLCELLPFGAFAQSDVGQQLTLAVAQSLEEENGEATIIGKCGDNLQWSLSSDGVLTIDGTGEMYDYDSDDSPAPWYDYSSKIKTVIINHGITHIGNSAFERCPSITSINIPDSVTSIGDYAFCYCYSLTTISIPSSINSIENGTFEWCSSLTSIDIPQSVVSIGSHAFASCTSLTAINIPDAVISISDSAFGGCTSLTFISIPESVTHLGDGALSGCTSLTSINIPDSITSINPYTFRNCTSLTSIIIPASVVSIGSGAFEGCTSLTAVNIPDSVVSIGKEFDTLGVFENCSSLASVSIPNSVTSIGSRIFSNCTSLVSIAIPQSISEISGSAFEGCTSLTSIDIPESITVIEGEAFSGCTSLSSINISNSVTEIGPNAFEGCIFLTSITLPESIAGIECGTFKDCTALTSINIPEFVTYISDSFTDEGAFENCTSLISISIPKSVTEIGRNAFKNCTALYDIYYSGTKNQWNAISIDAYQNDALLNATIHYLSSGAEEKTEFTFGRDNLSFLNKSGDFFSFADRANNVLSKLALVNPRPLNPSQKNQIIYNISDEKFDQLTTKLTPTLKKRFLDARLSEWGGSCRGMSTVVMLHYLHSDMLPLSQLPTISESTPYELPSPKDNDDVSNLINYYQLAQFLPTYQLKKRETLVNSLLDFSGTLSDLIDSLENGTPVLVGMQSNRGGHAVVFLKILSEDDNEYKISIYDPNYSTAQTLKLLKTPYVPASEEGPEGFLHVQYGTFNYIQCYIKASDLEHIDIRNYFGLSDNESYIDYDMPSISISPNSDIIFTSGDKTYYRTKNGEIVYSDSSIISFFDEYADETGSSNLNICIPSALSTSPIQLDIAPLNGTSDTNILLNSTLLSISTSGSVELTYNEAARTVDVTAEDPTDVNLLFTQNTTNEAWPWNSWAIDTTGTTSFHAELKDDGLHLSGDGIANAQYATENADTDIVDSGTIPAKANEVTIIKKDGNNQKTEIKDNTQTKPTDPDKLTVTVVDGKITAIDDVPIADDTTVLDNVAAETKITITADDKSADGKTFREWVVTPADSVTLSDASSSTASFTMGAVSVTIKAQYDSTTPTPTPTPGGGDSGSGGGGGDGGGAAVILGLGAAAAITAGIVLTMPVDVQGRVELADHAAVPGAKVSLLQNGNVVTQTTADESGNFFLKAKRGDYELTIVYTDANGQFVQKTSRIKAPTKDFVVTF